MEFEERAADPLAGGLMQGYQCGQLWGAALGAGAQAYRLYGQTPRAEAAAIIASQRILEAFEKRNKEVNCLELTGIDLKNAQMQLLKTFMKMFVEGQAIRCFSTTANTAHTAFRVINEAFSQDQPEPPVAPLSCSAVLAKKLGLTEKQAVMASGFAGGIGLSGGACGALGTALWALSMKNARANIEVTGLTIPGASDVIDVFVESSNYEFECAKIVGRRFENIHDHADHLRGGGCSKIIEALGN